MFVFRRQKGLAKGKGNQGSSFSVLTNQGSSWGRRHRHSDTNTRSAQKDTHSDTYVHRHMDAQMKRHINMKRHAIFMCICMHVHSQDNWPQCALLNKEIRLRNLICCQCLFSSVKNTSSPTLLVQCQRKTPPQLSWGDPHGSLRPLSPVAGKGKETESQEEREKSPDVIPKSTCLKRENMRPDLRPNMRPCMRCNMNPT